MSWFARYAQVQPGQAAGAGTDASPDGAVYVQEEGDGKAAGQVFDGQQVNAMIVNNLIMPMDSIPSAAMKYMMSAKDDKLAKFLVELAKDNRLKGFVDVVKSYVEDGVWMSVSSGSEEGMAALQKWYSDIAAYVGDRDIFGFSAISSDYGSTGVI
jgi:hypothetical protein